VVLDEAAVTNLELCATLIERKKRGSLLGVLDATRSAPERASSVAGCSFR
jgi:DNA mismatch repair ATPase MutS